MSSVIDDILSPKKDDPPIIDNTLQFKYKLDIGDEAYQYLTKADNFLDYSKSLVTGIGGGSIVGIAWFATLGPIAKFALLFGMTSTPVGWIAGAGALSSVLAYVLIKKNKDLKEKTTITIPRHLNTPLDLLAQSVIALIMPAAVRMALADGCLCVKERDAIINYFSREWGLNRDFVATAVIEQESLIADFSYDEYRQLMLATTVTDNEIKYDVIKHEMTCVLTEIINANELVSPDEQHEFEILTRTINEPIETDDCNNSESILNSIKRRKEAISDIVKTKFGPNNKTVSEPGGDGLFQRLRLLDDDNLNRLLLSGLRVSQKKLKDLDREGRMLLCSKELRLAAGSSVRNLFRNDHEFPYKQILIDVADRLAEGFTPLSWTKYKLGDSHAEQEIEDTIIGIFEERARKWWEKLPEKKKKEFIGGLQAVLEGEQVAKINLTGGIKTVLTQQLIDSIFQNGVTLGLTQVAAPGLSGLLGISIVAHIGWLILVQTLGFMTGIKIAILGIGGVGAFSGAVTFLGATAVGGVLSIPSTLLVMDGTAYRKTIPTVVMLLAMSRATSGFSSRA